MEDGANEIRVSYTDRDINALLEGAAGGAPPFTRHFNQQEAMFLRLAEEFTVPPLPIHHDVRQPVPRPEYLSSLREVLGRLSRLAPPVFEELTYLFDPRENLRPAFFKLYRVEGSAYLYLLQLDLMYRPHEHRVLERGDNDRTPRYATRHLFLEASFIPLEGVAMDNGKVRNFAVRQLISNTWIGEVGRGYFIQGIWMDNDLTKFFSRLFLPAGKRIYPFYPYVCKYKTVCQNVIRFSGAGRRQMLPHLHRVIQFLAPQMGRIERSMRDGKFSESNEVFRLLREKVPADWQEAWQGIQVQAYLNGQDMKEFLIED